MAPQKPYSDRSSGPPVAVPFCKPDYEKRERQNLTAAIAEGRLEGGGTFTKAAERRLRGMTAAASALVVPSCTAALEMMALLIGVQEGDEVIVPAYTFVSTANAIALRGATPVFVDIDPVTLNLDPAAVVDAITPRTKAIIPVHYAGVPCDMDELSRIGTTHGLWLLEDAAQALGATWNGQPAGGIGDMGAVSFHHTKNVTCGEGGALLVNAPRMVEAAEQVRDKGTDRASFLRGDINKYEWRVLGSSYLLSELAAAVLEAQLFRMEDLLTKRMAHWRAYDRVFSGLADVRTPRPPAAATHNAHIYHLRLPSRGDRDRFLCSMRGAGILAAPHYVPLHETPGGRRYGRSHGALPVTLDAADTLVRLPLFSAMSETERNRVIEQGLQALRDLDLA
ncbi:MAG: dTDP-4-amino-4,6-dideoxygalactose transaminase [Actinomycetota bacterium]